MSADARVWFEPNDGTYGRWHGQLDPDYEVSNDYLHRVIASIEEAATPYIYWYPEPNGLVGYGYPRKGGAS